jgi:hypothetical protein
MADLRSGSYTEAKALAAERVASSVSHMSTPGAADEWDFTVPEDDSELLAELRRHGVAPGRRLHVSLASNPSPVPNREPSPRRLSFAGSIHAEPDLSERTDDYLSGFGLG